jgi:hypothetical protein
LKYAQAGVNFMKKKYTLITLLLLCCTLLATCGSFDWTPREQFVVNLNSPQIPIGEVELRFNTFMSMRGLRLEKANVIYFPREDAVCIQYRHEFVTYHQFWSRIGRLEFLAALEKYNEEYTERTLVINDRRSKRNYGVVEGYLIWQMYSFTVQARANMNVELGYEFRDRSPFFTINQRQAEYKEDNSRDNNRTSPVITMYFTRAQAAQLADLFDPEFLRGVASRARPAAPETNAIDDMDEY